ncbi:MAG: arsenate reductase family protein [Bacilli bacterium]
MFEFLEYPKCSTCKKAKKYLEDNNISFSDRHIIDRKPTKEELNKWIILSKKEIKSWFNTSGVKYKELKLKDKLPNMTNDEKIELLSTDGMLVKRPILVTNNKVYIGFKEDEWKEIMRNEENFNEKN